eukprot:scaffold37496_cov63-Phaeocystis_antarctica.AAC.2
MAILTMTQVAVLAVFVQLVGCLISNPIPNPNPNPDPNPNPNPNQVGCLIAHMYLGTSTLGHIIYVGLAVGCLGA